MSPHNLFSLLAERLMLHSSTITINTYNVLFEVRILLQKISFYRGSAIFLYSGVSQINWGNVCMLLFTYICVCLL